MTAQKGEGENDMDGRGARSEMIEYLQVERGRQGQGCSAED
jgi:hypothetical protein